MNNGRDLSQSAREGAQPADADLAGPPARRAAPARVVFRRPVRWIAAGLFGVGIVMFLSGVIATSDLARLASGAAAAAACFLMVRAARARIVAEPGRLLVRNVYWTHKVGWSHIAGFEMPLPYGAVRKTGIQIRLHDGWVISAKAYARMGIDQFVDVTTRQADDDPPAAAGRDPQSQTKSQRPPVPGHTRPRPASIAAARLHVGLRPAASRDRGCAPQARGHWFEPSCAHQEVFTFR
jgi:hypothetical protein